LEFFLFEWFVSLLGKVSNNVKLGIEFLALLVGGFEELVEDLAWFEILEVEIADCKFVIVGNVFIPNGKVDEVAVAVVDVQFELLIPDWVEVVLNGLGLLFSGVHLEFNIWIRFAIGISSNNPLGISNIKEEGESLECFLLLFLSWNGLGALKNLPLPLLAVVLRKRFGLFIAGTPG